MTTLAQREALRFVLEVELERHISYEITVMNLIDQSKNMRRSEAQLQKMGMVTYYQG